MANTAAHQRESVLTIDGAVGDLTDRVIDAMVINLQDFSTDELRAVADYRENIWKDCPWAKAIRQYVEAWR